MDRIIAIFGSQNGKDSVLWSVLLAHTIDWYVRILSIAGAPMGVVSSIEQQEVLTKIHENLFNP